MLKVTQAKLDSLSDTLLRPFQYLRWLIFISEIIFPIVIVYSLFTLIQAKYNQIFM